MKCEQSQVILTENPVAKDNVKIRFNKKTKRLADSSDDDEEIEKQIQKLQAKKKKKPSKEQKPIDVQPVMNKKPKAWEISHLW